MDFCAYDPRINIGNPQGNNQNGNNQSGNNQGGNNQGGNQGQGGGNSNKILNTRNRVCTRDDPCGKSTARNFSVYCLDKLILMLGRTLILK